MFLFFLALLRSPSFAVLLPQNGPISLLAVLEQFARWIVYLRLYPSFSHETVEKVHARKISFLSRSLRISAIQFWLSSDTCFIDFLNSRNADFKTPQHWRPGHIVTNCCRSFRHLQQKRSVQPFSSTTQYVVSLLLLKAVIEMVMTSWQTNVSVALFNSPS